MTKQNILLSLLAVATFTACGTTQTNITPAKQKIAIEKDIVASDPTKSELQEAEAYSTHIESVKKRKKRARRVNKKKTKVNLKKFCFKDSLSIHYRAEERCKN